MNLPTPVAPDTAGRGLRWLVVEVTAVSPFDDPLTPPSGVARGVRGVATGIEPDGGTVAFGYGALTPVVGRRALLSAPDGAAPWLEDLLPEVG